MSLLWFTKKYGISIWIGIIEHIQVLLNVNYVRIPPDRTCNVQCTWRHSNIDDCYWLKPACWYESANDGLLDWPSTCWGWRCLNYCICFYIFTRIRYLIYALHDLELFILFLLKVIPGTIIYLLTGTLLPESYRPHVVDSCRKHIMSWLDTHKKDFDWSSSLQYLWHS